MLLAPLVHGVGGGSAFGAGGVFLGFVTAVELFAGNVLDQLPGIDLEGAEGAAVGRIVSAQAEAAAGDLEETADHLGRDFGAGDGDRDIEFQGPLVETRPDNAHGRAIGQFALADIHFPALVIDAGLGHDQRDGLLLDLEEGKELGLATGHGHFAPAGFGAIGDLAARAAQAGGEVDGRDADLVVLVSVQGAGRDFVELSRGIGFVPVFPNQDVHDPLLGHGVHFQRGQSRDAHVVARLGRFGDQEVAPGPGFLFVSVSVGFHHFLFSFSVNCWLILVSVFITETLNLLAKTSFALCFTDERNGVNEFNSRQLSLLLPSSFSGKLLYLIIMLKKCQEPLSIFIR